MGIASLVISIVAILMCLWPFIGFIISLFSLIFAIVAMCRKKNKEVNRGFKIAGLIISIIAFILSLLITGVLLISGALLAVNLGTELMDDATLQMGSISDSLQASLIENYAGKTITGAEVLAEVRQYLNSTTMSVVITTQNGVSYVGAGVISLPNGTTEDDYTDKGIKNGKIKEGTTSTYVEVSDKISMSNIYKTTVVYDNNDKIIGIAIIETTK